MSQHEHPAVVVDNVSKSFKLPHEKQTSLKGIFVGLIHGKRTYEQQQVLKSISFTINKGEFFGIVGRNGSGKSTLLKLLAGIYVPDSGNIAVHGSLAPFIELGVGFNPELTGRENVYLNGTLLGFTHKQIDGMYDEIVDFAELEKFMDQKLKNYSSGMQVRLAFSIAIRAKSDVLLIDEVLAVGDENFQRKCIKYFSKLKREKRTVIIVTHDMESVKKFCDRAMLIEEGTIKYLGLPVEAANQYSLDNLNTNIAGDNEVRKKISSDIKFLEVRALSPLSLTASDNFEFEIEYELNIDMGVDLGISVNNENHSIVEHNTKQLSLGGKKDTSYKLKYSLPLEAFNPKTFSVDVAIFDKKDFKLIGFDTNALTFVIRSDSTKPKGGLLAIKGEWSKI